MGAKDPELRVQIVEQRASFDENPTVFRESYKESQNQLTKKLSDARNLLKEVKIDYNFRVKISQICSELNVDGLRGDLVTNRCCKSISRI